MSVEGQNLIFSEDKPLDLYHFLWLMTGLYLLSHHSKTDMRTPLLTLVLLVMASCQYTVAQTLDYKWAKQASGASTEEFRGVTTDSDGNVIVTGTFLSQSITLDTITLTKADSLSNAMFVAKYTPSGSILWARMAKGISYGDDTQGFSVATDAFNNVFVAGDMYGDTVIFNTDTIALPPLSGQSGYVVKYSPNGTFDWVRIAYGARGTNSVTVDGNGSISFTGIGAGVSFQGSIWGSACGGGIWVAKYSNSGSFLGATQSCHSSATFGYTNEWTVNDVVADADSNVCITGWSGSDTTFFNAAKTVYVTNNASLRNMFLVKFDKNLNAIWAKGAAGLGTIDGKSIATSGNDIFLTGHFNDSINFSGSILVEDLAYQDAFVARFDASGNVVWAKSTGTNSNDNGNGIALDNSGNVYITGYFEGDEIFYQSTPVDTLHGGGKAMVFKYDGSGNLLSFQSPRYVPPYGTSLGHDIDVDDANNIYTAGWFTNSVGFGPDTIITPTNWIDAFVAQMNLIPTGLPDYSADLKLVVYPNPANELLNIALPEHITGSVSISLLDMPGKEMLHVVGYGSQHTLPLQSLPAGVFLVHVQTGDHLFSGKIIISR